MLSQFIRLHAVTEIYFLSLKVIANVKLFLTNKDSCKMELTFIIFYYFFIHSDYKNIV